MEWNGNVTFYASYCCHVAMFPSPNLSFNSYQALPYHFPVCNIEKLGNGHGDKARCNRYKSNSSCVGANMLVKYIMISSVSQRELVLLVVVGFRVCGLCWLQISYNVVFRSWRWTTKEKKATIVKVICKWQHVLVTHRKGVAFEGKEEQLVHTVCTYLNN